MNQRLAIYPSSFDPVTLGHIDVIRRSAKMFDKLFVAVATNSAKKCSFTIGERMDMLEKSVSGIPGVEVCTFEGLLADFARKVGAVATVRGLRAVSDFEYEFQLALTNKKLNGDLETVFLTTDSNYMFLSSSIVKEIACNGGDISAFVPAAVLDDIESRLKRKG